MLFVAASFNLRLDNPGYKGKRNFDHTAEEGILSNLYMQRTKKKKCTKKVIWGEIKCKLCTFGRGNKNLYTIKSLLLRTYKYITAINAGIEKKSIGKLYKGLSENQYRTSRTDLFDLNSASLIIILPKKT